MSELPSSRVELDGAVLAGEQRAEAQLRPRSLDEMIGQSHDLVEVVTDVDDRQLEIVTQELDVG